MTRAQAIAAGAGLTARLLLPMRALSSPNVVNVLYAGGLISILDSKSFVGAFARSGYDFQGEPKGSLELANLIRAGARNPDVFISADSDVMETLRGRGNGDIVRWYILFAASRLVIGYSLKSRFANDFRAVRAGLMKWTDVIDKPGFMFGATDPALNPKGYYALQSAWLAQQHYHLNGLADKLSGEGRVFPEETILARLELGEIDAAYLFATEAIARHLPYFELPPEVNLGDPKYEATYKTASVKVGGVTHRGKLIAFAATVPTIAIHPAGGAAFIRFLLSREGRMLLRTGGLRIVPPTLVGRRDDLPKSLKQSVE